jgi:hypothetical protein
VSSWARHYQETWQSRAGDPRLPYWLRVAALAYGSHADNGHARFKRGEIALVLGSVDRATGQIAPYENVGRAIKDAIEYGWLEAESYWSCLVVPAHAVKKGSLTQPAVPCPIHARRARRTREAVTERAVRLAPATTGERFATRSRHSVSGSQREPLSLSVVADASRPHVSADHQDGASA